MSRSVTWLCTVMAASLLAAGCGTQAPWVNCARKLEPINPPAPKAAVEPVRGHSAQAEQIAP